MWTFAARTRSWWRGRASRIAEMWAAHVASAPEGGAARGRWRAEAELALTMLTRNELARLPVRFVCEAQMMLEETYDVRARMHEVRRRTTGANLWGGSD